MSGYTDPTGNEAVSGRPHRPEHLVQCRRCGAVGSSSDRARFHMSHGELRHVVTKVGGTEGRYFADRRTCGAARVVLS